MDTFFIAALLFFALLFVTRIMNTRALSHLTNEQRGKLVKDFAKFRIWSFGITLLILVAYFAGIHYGLLDNTTLFIIVMFLMVAVLLAINVIEYKKLQSEDYPQGYIKFFIGAGLVRIVGIAAFLVIVMSDVL